MQHQKEFSVDPVTGVTTVEFMFPQGGPQEAMERAISRSGTRPGFELRTRWETKPDGAIVLRIGEVCASEVPPATDDLDGKSIGQLVSLGVREGLNGKKDESGNVKVALNTQMHIEDVRRHIRANRKAKAKAKVPETEPAAAGV